MGESDLPPFVIAERDALLVEISTAFSGVSREGGVTWNETEIIDLYGSLEERSAARLTDQDACWQDVLDDPNWDPEPGVGAWSFLDAIGFRYYLPAGMVFAIRRGFDSGICYHLTLSQGDLQEHRQDQWSRFDATQRLCIKRFLRYMAVLDGWYVAQAHGGSWYAALTSFWDGIFDVSVSEIEQDVATKPPL